jgi:hypothetical protein
MPTAPATVKRRHDRAMPPIKREKPCPSVSHGPRDGSPHLRGLAKLRWFAVVVQAYVNSTGPFFILSAIAAAVALAFLAGCQVGGAGDLAVESEGPAMAGEERVSKPDAEQQVPEGKATEDTVVVPGVRPDTMISNGPRDGSVSTAPSDGVSWGADQADSDARSRLIQKQMLLQGQINILDLQLKAFDVNPPLRSARNADPRSRPEVLERRLDLERSMLIDQQRQINLELQSLRFGRPPMPAGPELRRGSSQSLFGGSGR